MGQKIYPDLNSHLGPDMGTIDFNSWTTAERLRLAQELLDSVFEQVHSAASGSDAVVAFTCGLWGTAA